jgi:hypothetical protein
MAFTERYVTQAAAGGGDGSSGSPWTFAEAVAAAAAGDRINVQSDSAYSIGATTLPAGTVSAPIVWRGYESAIGDLDGNGRNTDGTLNTTNMPAITLTGILLPSGFVTLQNLVFTGALSSTLIGNVNLDQWNMLSCSVTNSQSNASAACVFGDDSHRFINCDFYCSGATHSRLVLTDLNSVFEYCRFRLTDNKNCLETNNPQIMGCLFWGNGSGIGVDIDVAFDALRPINIRHSTFYNLGTAIRPQSFAPGSTIYLSHNHATDCSKWIDNLYAATANITSIEFYNRLRDITTPRTGVEAIIVGEITTDTGGAATDYEDAGAGDFHLITAAPGYNAGVDGSDIGAYQTDPPSGGGDFPDEADVRLGVDYDDANLTGTLIVPAVGDVRNGVTYDDGVVEGVLDLPAEADVRAGVEYDNETKEGTLTSGITVRR